MNEGKPPPQLAACVESEDMKMVGRKHDICWCHSSGCARKQNFNEGAKV